MFPTSLLKRRAQEITNLVERRKGARGAEFVDKCFRGAQRESLSFSLKQMPQPTLDDSRCTRDARYAQESRGNFTTLA